MSTCSLCTINASCPSSPLLIHARTPILRERVRETLAAFDGGYQECGGLFAFPVDADVHSLLSLLRATLSDPEKNDLRVWRGSTEDALYAGSLTEEIDRESTIWFDEALRGDRFEFHFQPIVDVRSHGVHAYEALVRLFADRAYSGGEIVEAAVRRGSVHVFDAYCRGKAIATAAGQQLEGAKLFVNFLPSSIYDPAHCLKSTVARLEKTQLQASDVVFEVVESEQIRDLNHLRRIRDYYRERGFGFALDDVGSGSNSLQMVCDFKPDYVKLDKSLTRGIEEPMKATVVRLMVGLANEFGLQIIAEGVETADMAGRLADAGVRLMQGWAFGRPAAVAEWK